jgi:quercetin 2,3-dioxygenase
MMMSHVRPVRKTVSGKRTVDGAGVSLVRVIGYHDTAEFDPFLMLDAFDSTDPEDYIIGFPWHPHRGIETVTYLIHGDIEHGDSLGNRGSILDGDCQWMTAGSGIIHQEMPKACKHMLGAQLWLNLPARDKMCEPHYGDIKSRDIPVIEGDGSRIRIIAGNCQGVQGAFQGLYIQATYLDAELVPGHVWTQATASSDTVFVYILQGDGCFSPDSPGVITEKQAVLFGDGDQFWVRAGDKGIRFLMFSGQPLHEPVAWGGPIVMNTREELDLAFKELETNTFIKTKKGFAP